MVGGAALATGAVLGIRHALESDHIAAIATLVDEDTDRPSLVGVSWGIGHSLMIAALGLLFVLLGVQLPAAVTQLFEVIAGSILICLGARMLWTISGEIYAHDHDRRRHRHVRFGRVSLGLTHQHVNGESFFVGLIHGVAGSGILVIALVSAAPTVPSALSFLATFSVFSILMMALVSVVWGRALETTVTTYLQGGAGLFSIGIGVLLIVTQAGRLGVL